MAGLRGIRILSRPLPLGRGVVADGDTNCVSSHCHRSETYRSHRRIIVGVVITVIMVKVILVIFVSGMRFQCHYINIIKIIFYIVSRKESAKSFLTLMTNDLNDRVSLCSKWKVKSEKWRVVVNKVIGHYGHFRFSRDKSINHRFNKFTRTKL